MLRQLIKKAIVLDEKNEGLTIVEALLSAVILGIGFAGVYTMSAVSLQSMDQSISKQKMQMQANQILEIIENDITNIDSYIMALDTCVEPDVGETLTYIIRGYEWCSRLAGEVGAASAGDTRSINVTTLPDGRKVVHVLLESNNGRVQVVMKRVYDG